MSAFFYCFTLVWISPFQVVSSSSINNKMPLQLGKHECTLDYSPISYVELMLRPVLLSFIEKLSSLCGRDIKMCPFQRGFIMSFILSVLLLEVLLYFPCQLLVGRHHIELVDLHYVTGSFKLNKKFVRFPELAPYERNTYVMGCSGMRCHNYFLPCLFLVSSVVIVPFGLLKECSRWY